MTKENYFRLMHLKNRCVFFTDDRNKVRALATFVITDDPINIRRNGIWGVPEENPQGRFIYADRLITDRQSPIKCNMMELIRYFSNKFPDKKMVWQSRRRRDEKLCFENSKQ